MVELLTVKEFADAVGVDTKLARNWCERGHIECANPSDGTYLISASVVESLTDGIDPAANKRDRVELFSRVNDPPEPKEAIERPLDATVYARFDRTFRQQSSEAPDSEDDLTYYLDRYGMIVHRVADLIPPSPAPTDQTIEQLSADIGTLLAPLRAPTDTVGDVSLRSVLEGIDELLQRGEAQLTYEFRTTLLELPDGTQDPQVRTTLVVTDIIDGAGIAVPEQRHERSYPVYEQYCDTWQTSISNTVSALDQGDTFLCAFAPSASDKYRFEFRAGAVQRPFTETN